MWLIHVSTISQGSQLSLKYVTEAPSGIPESLSSLVLIGLTFTLIQAPFPLYCTSCQRCHLLTLCSLSLPVAGFTEFYTLAALQQAPSPPTNCAISLAATLWRQFFLSPLTKGNEEEGHHISLLQPQEVTTPNG